ncbi:MAG: fructosamine kinase family protein [Epsilonproteobacteria bacterium]|nr:fructosamine kinase family protein [Campylobacterota bacterium]
MKDNIAKILRIPIRSCTLIAQNSSAYIYNCDDKYLVKVSEQSFLLKSEAQMLEYLREYSNLPIPNVVKKLENILITEYVPNNGVGKEDAELDAAIKLAALHRIQDEKFGFATDTTVGLFEQSNKQNSSWIDFFKRERILDFANKTLIEGKISEKLYDRIILFCEDFDKYLIEPEFPSLLHGDVWSGNVLIENGEVVSFIDPAIYYGHHEIELAFIMLFSTFDDSFFQKYNELFPIAEGFYEERVDIYNLYPYLVHARAFGSSYIPYIEKIVEKYGY